LAAWIATEDRKVSDSPQPENKEFIALIVQSAVLPVLFLIVGVLARRLGRRDGDDTPRPNDWAAATSVLLMNLGKVSGDLIEAVRKKSSVDDTLNIMWWILGLGCMTFFSISRDRYDSWVVADEFDKRRRFKRFWGGIVIPNAIAVLIFGVYQYGKLKNMVP
jgi:hypothetical protein